MLSLFLVQLQARTRIELLHSLFSMIFPKLMLLQVQMDLSDAAEGSDNASATE